MKRVLIVEDDSSILHLFSNGIGGEFSVQGATDGREARGKIGEGVDLILLDLASKNIAPMCFLKNLRESNNHTPVIAISSLDEKWVRSQIEEFDVVALIKKPLSVEKLMEVVRKSSGVKEDLDFLMNGEVGGGITTFCERQRVVQEELRMNPKFQRPMEA